MPRLHLSFGTRQGQDGNTQLYSLDYNDLHVTNQRDSRLTELLKGIPHSLLLSNDRDEMQILVPCWHFTKVWLTRARRWIACHSHCASHLIASLPQSAFQPRAGVQKHSYCRRIHLEWPYLLPLQGARLIRVRRTELKGNHTQKSTACRFLFAPTLAASIYLGALRFAHEDYNAAFRLADSFSSGESRGYIYMCTRRGPA